ncbi:hypothetical protein AB0425_13855 [Actinosynnema sp. NPDC051121]
MTDIAPHTDERTLDFVVAFDDESAGGGDKGLFSSHRDSPRVQAISVATLRQNLVETMANLRAMFDGVVEFHPDLPIKEVTVSFEVTATGKVTLLGTGAEMTGTGAITITFGK